jgi:hypothetical protein
MNATGKLIIYLIGTLWLVGMIGGCKGSAVESVQPDSPVMPHLVSISAEHLEQEVRPGDIPEFPLIVSHNIPGVDELVVGLEALDGESWRAALCFEDQCFFYNGSGRMEKILPISTAKPLEVVLKLFIPEEAMSGESATIRLVFTQEGKSATSESAIIKGFVP